MQINAISLLEELRRATEKNIDIVRSFKTLSNDELNYRESPQSWTVLECLEHLNLYGDFYLKELEERIINAPKTSGNPIFRSGYIGNYFALMMLPKGGRSKKMKTFKDKDPLGSKLDITTIDRFLKQQYRTLDLLKMAENVDLTKAKTAISISKMIKLRLGDTFRVVIYHNERHILQAQNILSRLKKTMAVQKS